MTIPHMAEERVSEAPVEVGYTNWRGEYAVRHIVPIKVWYGSTDWHPEPQWLLHAIDADKNAERDFAIKDLGLRSPATPGADDRVGERWQDISTAPEDGTEVIVAGVLNGQPYVLSARKLSGDEGWYETNNDPTDAWGFGEIQPSHWQPFPTPPALSTKPAGVE